MKNTLLFIFACLAMNTAFADTPPKVDTYRLDNGLTVILHEDHTQPKVFGVVITKAGGKDDPDNATGMAHYQEHMLFKGTESLGTINWDKEKPHIDKIFKLYDQLGQTTNDSVRKEIQSLINKESIEAGKYAILNETSFLINLMGGTSLNAGTGNDQTLFYNQFPPNQIERWLDLYAERFHNPVFRSFQSELEVVYEEKNMYDDQFFSGLFEIYNKNFFKKHPYGQKTILGTTDDLKNPSLSKMYQFFQQWYRPSNMALVLVGDFDSETIKPMIAEKFGVWQVGKVPEHKTYAEEPFVGREFFKVRMSPIPIAGIGFRTPNQKSDEALLWDLTMKLLSNNMQTGLLDQLMVNNEMPLATTFSIPYFDYGQTMMLYFPGFFKSLKKGEKKIMQQLELLKDGEFSDELLHSVKTEMYKNYILELESFENLAVELAYTFTLDKDPKSIYDRPALIKSYTRDDIIAIANKYLTDNRLVMYSKIGFPKKDKLEKPEYKPVVSNTNAKSPYREKFEKIETTNYTIDAVDFEKVVAKKEVFPHVTMRWAENEKNDIAELNIQFKKGDKHNMMLKYATMAMNYATPNDMTLIEFKEEMGKTNCTYNFYNTDPYTGISIKGPEQKIGEALALINQLLEEPVIDKDKIKQIYKETKIERRMEKTEPDIIASGLYNYLIYGENSEYKNRLPLKDIKKLKGTDLIADFKDALKYEVDLFYVGKNTPDEVSDMLQQNGLFLTNVQNNGLEFPKPNFRKFKENEVYFINHERANQSKMFLFINQDVLSTDEIPVAEAFNMYFGGGFSGLVLQEIREYRSMAYSAGAKLELPEYEGLETLFFGFVGTQCDKTTEALKIFYDLIRDMPQKQERMNMIKEYLINAAITKKPTFRSYPWMERFWTNLGYEGDPTPNKIEAYKKLTFDDIVKFYEKKIKEQAVVIAVVGNAEQISMDELQKYGTLTIKEWDEVFTE